ncbi:hypothetical protein Q5752_006448 [Cryptotrichosporon argae]
MITVTVVRHGESTDNLRAVWAGWADAPLSNHGMNQAKALGASLKNTKIDAIYASPLLRARWTAEQIHSHQPNPPPLTLSPLLREQHFGVAERKPFGGGGTGEYVRLPGRTFKFPDGESLGDVRARANDAVAQFIEPHLRAAHGQPPASTHVVVVAHGIFNSELLGALLARRNGPPQAGWGYRGMTNTGWTRLEVGYADEAAAPARAQVVDTHPPGVDLDANPMSGTPDPDPMSGAPAAPVTASSIPPAAATPPPQPLDPALPPLVICITCADVTSHLEGVHRQKGGIGSAPFDAGQKSLKAFFGAAQ